MIVNRRARVASRRQGAPSAWNYTMVVRRCGQYSDRHCSSEGTHEACRLRLVRCFLRRCSASPALASPELAQKKNCMACHARRQEGDRARLQGRRRQVRGQQGRSRQAGEKILKGGAGVWGAVPMPANAGRSPRPRPSNWLPGCCRSNDGGGLRLAQPGPRIPGPERPGGARRTRGNAGPLRGGLTAGLGALNRSARRAARGTPAGLRRRRPRKGCR